MSYKVLVVDDELIEREALSTLVEWDSIDSTLIGSARNGIQALEMVENELPDIIVTDIKMPRMDGLGLISACREKYPDIVFVILSGYGEFEFTSRAMELGIRHYILKPVDSEKVLSAVSKAIADVDSKRLEMKKSEEQEDKLRMLLPAARSQFFLRLITGAPVSEAEMKIYGEELSSPLFLLSARIKGYLDSSSFSALREYLEENVSSCSVLFSARNQNEIHLLLASSDSGYLQHACREVENYLAGRASAAFAITSLDSLSKVRSAKIRNDELIAAQKEERWGTLVFSSTASIGEEVANNVLDRAALHSIDSSLSLYRYALSFSQKLTLFSRDEKIVLVRTLAEELGVDAFDSERAPIFDALENVFPSADEDRVRMLYRNLFLSLDMPELSVRWISGNIMFMSEDYFSRFFLKSTGLRFTEFVNRERIALAISLLNVRKELTVQQLSSLTGYPEDGQYFSRQFKNYAGETVAKWREKL